LTYLQQALQLREKINDTGRIAETLRGIGQVYSTMGQYDQSLTASMRALDLWRKAGDTLGAANESHDIGLVLLYQGRFGPAIDAMQDAAKGNRASGERSAQTVELLNDLADALAQSGRGSESGPLLQEAQGIANGFKNEDLRAELLNTQGDVRRYDGDWKSAKGFYDQAALAASRSGDPEEVLISKLHVAEAAMNQGNVTGALREFRGLKEQADTRNLKYRSLVISADIAEATIRSKDYSHAEQELQAALGKSEKLGTRDQTARIHYLFGNALRLSGNTADAPIHYRQAVALIEAMRKEPGAEKLADRADLKAIVADASQFAGPSN